MSVFCTASKADALERPRAEWRGYTAQILRRWCFVKRLFVGRLGAAVALVVGGGALAWIQLVGGSVVVVASVAMLLQARKADSGGS